MYAIALSFDELRAPLLPAIRGPNDKIFFYCPDPSGPPTPAAVFKNPTLLNPENHLAMLSSYPCFYMVYVIRDIMRPAWKCGDTLFISPDQPCFTGDFIVVIPKDPDGHMAYRELIDMDNDWLTLREHNPLKVWKYPRDEIAAIHVIVGIRKGV